MLSIIDFSSDSRVMTVVIEGVRVLSFSLAVKIQARNPRTFTKQPITSLLLFPTPLYFLSLNKWHQQAVK